MAVDYCRFYDLPCPTRKQTRQYTLRRVISLFWWNEAGICDLVHTRHSSHKPATLDERWFCEDWRSCLRGMCSAMEAAYPDKVTEIRCMLRIDAATWRWAVEGWLSESDEFRWMVAHLIADLRHPQLSTLVLGEALASSELDRRQR